MQLITRRESTSFYESFSDLIFCTLVLFIILVMILSLSVNEQVETYAKEQEEINQKLVAQNNELMKKREELSKIEKEVEKEKHRINELKGETRFRSHFGKAYFYMACDSISQPPRYWPIPYIYFHEINTNRIGLSEDEKKARVIEIEKRVLELSKNNRSYSAQELGTILGSFSYYTTSESGQISRGLNIPTIQTKNGLKILEVLPKSAAADAGLKKGDIITHINDLPLDNAGQETLRDEIDKGKRDDKVILKVNSPNLEPREISCKKYSEVYFSKIIERTSGRFDILVSGLMNADGKGKIKDEQGIKQLLREKRPNLESNSKLGLAFTTLALVNGLKDSLMKFTIESRKVDTSEFRAPYTGSLPELNIYVNQSEEIGRIANIELTPDEILQLVKAIGGRGAILNWIVEDNAPMPEWIKKKILEPSGFMDKVPRI